MVKAAESSRRGGERHRRPTHGSPPAALGRHGRRERLKSLADQRAEELAEAERGLRDRRQHHGGQRPRDKALKDQAAEARAAGRAAGRAGTDRGQRAGLPELDASAIQGERARPACPWPRYRIAARFGQVGTWSRYHTGFDFSAPIGTAIRAPSAGVVTNAGIGPASGWAGNYVAIKYPDGTQTLMAHMSTVSVSVGQTVSACQVVGRRRHDRTHVRPARALRGLPRRHRPRATSTRPSARSPGSTPAA